MTKAIRIHKTGGPEVLTFEDVDVGKPGSGEVRLIQKAIGLNFIEVYHRTGLYPVPSLPHILGMEGAAVIEELGPDVTGFSVGQRVGYAGAPMGAYAEERLMPAARLIALPDQVDDQTAAAMLLQGMTAEYLVRRTYGVQTGDTILVHAAAGGVGSILCQWASHIGATVIGTAGSEAKAERARANGCAHTILYAEENFTDRVQDITDGQGVAVVYDSVGAETFEGSLDCLRPRGTMVSFGNASGPVPAVDPGILATKGSLFLTRPTLVHHVASRDDLLESANALFDVVKGGHVKIDVMQTYPLSETAQAHRDLEARRTTGSTVIIP